MRYYDINIPTKTFYKEAQNICKYDFLCTIFMFDFFQQPHKIHFVLAGKISWKISEFFAKTLSGLKKWNCTWIYEEWKKKFWPFRDCFRSLLQASRLELASLVVLYIVCHATTFQCLAKNFFLPQHIDLESKLYFEKVLTVFF